MHLFRPLLSITGPATFFLFLSAFAIVNSPFFTPQLAFNSVFCLERGRELVRE
jgi:hypothetical protein